MRVILIDSLPKLGKLGDQVNVKSGYARNFLLPKDKALLATKKNIEHFEARRTIIEEKEKKILQSAKDRATKLESIGSIEIFAKAGNEGKLFGSIGTRDIAEAVNAAGVEISRNEIRLYDGALRSLGDYTIPCKLHSHLTVELNISVVAN